MRCSPQFRRAPDLFAHLWGCWMKTCPECCSEIPEQAEVCQACGRRIVGKQCPECAELSKTTARKCQYCRRALFAHGLIPEMEMSNGTFEFKFDLNLRVHGLLSPAVLGTKIWRIVASPKMMG